MSEIKMNRFASFFLAAIFFGLFCSKTDAREVWAGYQGWFICPTEEFGSRWSHWYRMDGTDDERLRVDLIPLLPDSGLTVQCKPKLPVGNSVESFYSSEDPHIINYHLRLAKSSGIDVIVLQRFIVETKPGLHVKHRNAVLRTLMNEADKVGIRFFIMYDVTGVADAEIVSLVQLDLQYLARAGVFSHKYYYKRNDRSALALWGLGFFDRKISLSTSNAVVAMIRNASNFYLVGGVPAYWSTLDRDSRPESGWKDFYLSFDAVSPWMVGRFKSIENLNESWAQLIRRDVGVLYKKGVDYVPVIYPGFSAFNQHGKALVEVPRVCGKFLQAQLDIVENERVGEMVYVAMLDEYDEGTAVLPAVYGNWVTQKGDVLFGGDLVGECAPDPFRYLKILSGVVREQ